jgi:hypothetical protein
MYSHLIIPKTHSLMTESFIKFGHSFVASTSDFWHHPVWKCSFGACIGNFITNGYQMKNGMLLAMSQTTIPQVNSLSVISGDSAAESCVHHRCQALLDFCTCNKLKMGHLIGCWLEECHRAVRCKPNYISSHIVDGAANAGKSVQTFQWNMGEERSQKIVADGCDAQKIKKCCKHCIRNESACGKFESRVRTGSEATLHKALQEVLDHVRKENGRVKTPQVQSSVVTMWNHAFDETECANANQHNLDVAIKRIVAPDGAIENLRKNNDSCEEVDKNGITEAQWRMYA